MYIYVQSTEDYLTFIYSTCSHIPIISYVPMYVLSIGVFPTLYIAPPFFFLKYNLRRSLSSRYILAPSTGGLAQKHRRTML